MSEGTFYTWKRKYAGMEGDDVRRLRELEAENAALKRIVAEQALGHRRDGEAPAKKWVSASERRAGATFLDGGRSLQATGVQDDGDLAPRLRARAQARTATRTCGSACARCGGPTWATARRTRWCGARWGRSTSSGCIGSGRRRGSGA